MTSANNSTKTTNQIKTNTYKENQPIKQSNRVIILLSNLLKFYTLVFLMHKSNLFNLSE